MPITDVLSDMVFSPQSGTQGAESTRSVTVTASPFTYRATSRQALHVTGGSISTISYSRGGVSLSLGIIGGGTMIEMNAGDSVVIAYLTVPTLTVLPR